MTQACKLQFFNIVSVSTTFTVLNSLGHVAFFFFFATVAVAWIATVIVCVIKQANECIVHFYLTLLTLTLMGFCCFQCDSLHILGQLEMHHENRLHLTAETSDATNIKFFFNIILILNIA